MSALFNFTSLLQVILLIICSCTYFHLQWPTFLNNGHKTNGFLGVVYKFARVGERASPYVSLGLLFMVFNLIKS